MKCIDLIYGDGQYVVFSLDSHKVRQDVWATQSSTNTILVFLFLFAQKVN